MTGRYLTDLADVLRAAGCDVVEMPDWQTRARSSGGFANGRPWVIMWHHTASAGDGAADASYVISADDAPISNIVIGRDGVVYVCAAGASNTNGKGGPLAGFSRGTVPADQMNTHALGIEISNNGVGQSYPQTQIDACFAVSNACAAAYELASTDVANHFDWAPGRKIDCATAPAVEGPWQPRSNSSSGTWALDDLRAECARRAGTLPPPPHPTGEVDMYVIAVVRQGWPGPVDLVIAADGTRWNANGNTSGLDRLAGVPRIENVSKDQALGLLVDRGGIGPHPFARPEYRDDDLAAAW